MDELISKDQVRRYVSRYTFKQEGMGVCVMAGQYNRLKAKGITPVCMGFFVGKTTWLSTDIYRFLSAPKQQKRLFGFLQSDRDGIFSSIMPYIPNEFYSCKGLLQDGSHNWRDGAITLDSILIRFYKEGSALRLQSIYPVENNNAGGRNEKNI